MYWWYESSTPLDCLGAIFPNAIDTSSWLGHRLFLATVWVGLKLFYWHTNLSTACPQLYWAQTNPADPDGHIWGCFHIQCAAIHCKIGKSSYALKCDQVVITTGESRKVPDILRAWKTLLVYNWIWEINQWKGIKLHLYHFAILCKTFHNFSCNFPHKYIVFWSIILCDCMRKFT